MPSTVIANPELSRGGVVLTAHSYNADDEGGVVYNASYVCLSQFDARNTALFARNAQPPTPLPESMAALRIVYTPKLTNVTIERSNGLTYFNGTYIAAVRGVYTETEDESWKVYSKTRIERRVIVSSTEIYDLVATKTFDYISKTNSRTSKFAYLLPKFDLDLVGPPQNVEIIKRVEKITDVSQIQPLGDNSAFYEKPSSIITRSRNRAANGQSSFTINQTGIYL